MENDFTVGDLRRALGGLPDDTKLVFPAGLTFYRLKRCADDEFVFEFGEAEAELSPTFRKNYPSIIAAFWRTASPDTVSVSYVPRL
jgi:hypothetical protein